MALISQNGIERTQEQAIASWIGYLYSQRIFKVREAFSKQDINLSEALKELNLLKLFVADKDHILGNLSSKHGEIAEHCQVNISNARNLVNGLISDYTFENVGRLAPEDYLKNGRLVQSKFYNGAKGTIKAIIKHFETYPFFLREGGSYEIPRDQFEEIKRALELYKSDKRYLLSKKDMTLLKWVFKMQDESGISFQNDIHSSVVSFDEVQVLAVDSTIAKEEQSINDTDMNRRKKTVESNKPGIGEGIDITIKSALIEGGVKTTLEYIRKRKEGKNLASFTIDDWKDIGIEFAKGSITGGVRGGAVYSLTNYTATPACIASAYVTASYGICGMLDQYRKGNIDAATFIINCEAISLDVSISAISSLVGQTIIPVPILGAVIGNVVGEVVFGICKDKCSEAELQLISTNRDRLAKHRIELDNEYSLYVRAIDAEFAHFSTIEELAFNDDANIAISHSVQLARMVGVPKDRILESDDDLRHFLED